MRKSVMQHICDFCGKTQDQVDVIIAGRNTDICNECVAICVEVINEKKHEKNDASKVEKGEAQ